MFGRADRRSRRWTACYVARVPRASGTPRSAICGKYAVGGPKIPSVSIPGCPESASRVSDSLGNDVLLDGEPDEIGCAGRAECLKEMCLVVLDGPYGNVEFRRNLLHAFALRQQAQHVALAGRELAFGPFWRGGEIPKHVACDQRRQVGSSARHRLDRVEELV